jgi:hypothetical protein
MTKSKVALTALAEMDPQFAELCDTLFGKSIDPVDVWAYVYTPEGVSKMIADDEVRKASAKRVARGALKATGALATGVAGGVAANQFPQQKGDWKFKKAAPDQADLNATGRGKPMKPRKPHFKATGRTKDEVVKSVIWDVEFSKVDDDKHQVFGWASIVEMNGKPVVDRQGDWISPEEIEKAAYTYVVKSRTGGHQHKRTETGEVFKASDMIESFVVTDEKVSQMGLPDDTPRGWWVGYHISDEDAWRKVKSREVTGFSIHGRGKRVEVNS